MASAIKLKNEVKKLEAAKKAATKGKNTKLAAKFESQIGVLNSQIKALNKPTSSPAVQAAKQLAREYKAKYGVAYNGIDIEKDAVVPAMKTGRRVSQGIKGNQFSSKGESKGHVYYEYRENRIDRNAKRYPKLENGGVMAKGMYVAIGEYDGYWSILSKPCTKQQAMEMLSDLPLRKGEVGKVVTLEQAMAHKKVIGREYLKKYADGGSLDSILVDTGGASSTDVGGTLFSNADLTPQMDITNPMFAKGGKLNNYKYVPNRMIQAVEVERNGRETEIDGANVIDGLYVKKGVKFEHGGEIHRGQGDSMYAHGGMMEHGLEVGDTVLSHSGYQIVVKNNKTGKTSVVNLNTGKRS